MKLQDLQDIHQHWMKRQGVSKTAFWFTAEPPRGELEKKPNTRTSGRVQKKAKIDYMDVSDEEEEDKEEEQKEQEEQEQDPEVQVDKEQEEEQRGGRVKRGKGKKGKKVEEGGKKQGEGVVKSSSNSSTM